MNHGNQINIMLLLTGIAVVLTTATDTTTSTSAASRTVATIKVRFYENIIVT